MPRTETESKRDVTDADAAFHQALASADINKLTALTESTFIWTQGTTQMSQKQLVSDLGAGRLKYVKPASSGTISVYGDTAIVRGDAGRYTLTFINQGGTWKAVAMHTSN